MGFEFIFLGNPLQSFGNFNQQEIMDFKAHCGVANKLLIYSTLQMQFSEVKTTTSDNRT